MKYSLVLIVTALFLFHVTSAFTKDVFFVADDVDAAPYISADSETRPTGIFYDIVAKAFSHMKKPFKYEVYPWKRAQMLVVNREADALITIPTSQRLDYLIASQEPVFVMRYKIFTQRDNPNIEKIRSVKNLNDLKELKIIDYIGDGWAEKNLMSYGVDWSNSLTSACAKIAAHRGDVFLQDEIMVLHAIKKLREKKLNSFLDFDNVVSFDAPVEQVGFHLLIHKESRFVTLMSEFDETIRLMRENGEIEEIRDKWIK